MSAAIPCVVKANSPTGTEYWIGPASFGGFRTFGYRGPAEVFASFSDAYAAIDSLPSVLSASGVVFTLEAAAEARFESVRCRVD
jgi:hypothetical protein